MSEGRGQKADVRRGQMSESREHEAEEFGIGFLKTYGIKLRSAATSFYVFPAKAGIQCFQIVLDACLRRHDGISDFLRDCQRWTFDDRRSSLKKTITSYIRLLNIYKTT